MKALTLLPVAALVPSAWLVGNWLALVLAALAVITLACGLLLRKRTSLAQGLYVTCVVLVLLASGGLLMPGWLGGWVALGAVAALACLFGLLSLTGIWSREAALAL